MGDSVVFLCAFRDESPKLVSRRGGGAPFGLPGNERGHFYCKLAVSQPPKSPDSACYGVASAFANTTADFWAACS